MAPPLPPLRPNLDLMPSPVPDQPGLLVRDPLGFAEATLIIPPALVACLRCFDGKQTELELRELLVRLTGSLEVGQVLRHLFDTLSSGGFLEDEVFERRRESMCREFAEAEVRAPSHAGSAYPSEPENLSQTLGQYLDGGSSGEAAETPLAGLIGIAAPHVSLEGGWASYRAAYRTLQPEHAARTFVILGTSHFGDAESFGLTCKPFETPFGRAQVDLEMLETLAERAGPAARMEDYCHRVEHSVEFQVIFLQQLYGPGVQILPILCGPFAKATQLGGRPEDDPGVEQFLRALGGLSERESHRLLWVLGVDLAHMGRRYGDSWEARAGQGEMVSVAEQDRERIERLVAVDPDGFWELVQEHADPLKWCGSAALYTFLRTAAAEKGHLLRYDQWNIDEQSVVSFAGLAFS